MRARALLRIIQAESFNNLHIASSDPKSKNYGQHYAPDEVVELFAPATEAAEAVKNWLVTSGISSKTIVIPKSKGWVHFDATVSQLETALKTEYHRYEHVHSGVKYFGTHKYHLPSNVSKHVDFIVPAVAMAHLSDTSHQATRRRSPELKRQPATTELGKSRL